MCQSFKRFSGGGHREADSFAFSYAAKEIFQLAKRNGWQTVLGQIDPGPRESDIVEKEFLRRGAHRLGFHKAPKGYWRDWQDEVELSDVIVVNSRWSKECLTEVGIDINKIAIVPCAYEANTASEVSPRIYPTQFSDDRPMRVLFLGQTIARKGIHLLMQAARMLVGCPVEFLIAGDGLDIDIEKPSNSHWLGRVPREDVQSLYASADVFILPTLSDGFAITQLEALAWRLPVIVSRNCGDVVVDGVNGIKLQDTDVEQLQQVLHDCILNPARLSEMSRNASVPRCCSIDSIGEQLIGLENRGIHAAAHPA